MYRMYQNCLSISLQRCFDRQRPCKVKEKRAYR